MKRLTPEERRDRSKKKKQARLDAKPVIGMAHYVMGDGIATIKLQVVGLTKHSVTMRLVSGTGTIQLSTNNGQPIEEVIKIERMPCSTIPTLTHGDKTVELSQGAECGL